MEKGASLHSKCLQKVLDDLAAQNVSEPEKLKKTAGNHFHNVLQAWSKQLTFCVFFFYQQGLMKTKLWRIFFAREAIVINVQIE